MKHNTEHTQNDNPFFCFVSPRRRRWSQPHTRKKNTVMKEM